MTENKSLLYCMKGTVAVILSALSVICTCSCAESTSNLKYTENGDIINPAEITDAAENGRLSDTRAEAPGPFTESGIEYGDISRTEYTYGNQRISFLAVGDNICHESVANDAAGSSSGSEFDFSGMYQSVSEQIKTADIALINQVSLMPGTGNYSYFPSYSVPTEMGEAVMDLGFDIVNLTTDHMLDCGTDGLEATEKYFSDKGAFVLGAYENAEDLNNIRIMDYNGIRIAFVYYTNKTVKRHSSSSDTYIPYIDTEDMKKQTALASQNADFVIAVMHWGTENSFEVSENQRMLASLLASNGADVIIGAGAHVLQPIEWIAGTEGRKTLVAYSLGNFLSGMYYARNSVGGILSFDIIVSFENEAPKISVENVICTPTVCHYSTKRDGFRIYYLSDYTDSLCMSHGSQNFDRFTFFDIVSCAKDHISEEFLPPLTQKP